MFEDFKENFLNMVTSRVFVLIVLMVTIAVVIIHRIFDLQIVNGEYYLDSFQTKIRKERTIQGSRGCIYDRNGNLLGRMAKMIEPEEEALISRKTLPPRVDMNDAFRTAKLPVVTPPKDGRRRKG